MLTGLQRLTEMGRPRPTQRRRWEVHVPIAPTPVFLLRVRMLGASLRRFGDIDPRLVVWVSRDVEPYDLHDAEPWSRELGVEWRWVSQDDYERLGIYGTALGRFTCDYDADFVVQLDADMLCTGSLADLPRLVGDGLGGVQAWMTPMQGEMTYRDGRVVESPTFWHELFEHCRLPTPALTEVHPAMQAPAEHRFAPPYFNLGLLAGTADTTSRVGAAVLQAMADVDAFVDTRFRCQLAVTIAAHRTGVPLVPLPLSFNMPNNPWVWDLHPGEQDPRLIHYVMTEEIDREALSSVDAVRAIVDGGGYSPVNEVLRARMAALLPERGDEAGRPPTFVY